jgi:hypothetical protein
MYNLNVSLSAPPLLSVEGGSGFCTTPRTPEILNSLMAMTNPLEYSYPASTVQQPQVSRHFMIFFLVKIIHFPKVTKNIKTQILKLAIRT